jgi:hypothetical protein
MNRSGFVAVVAGVILALGVSFPTSVPIVSTAQAAQAVRLVGGQFGGWIDAIHRAEGARQRVPAKRRQPGAAA